MHHLFRRTQKVLLLMTGIVADPESTSIFRGLSPVVWQHALRLLRTVLPHLELGEAASIMGVGPAVCVAAILESISHSVTPISGAGAFTSPAGTTYASHQTSAMAAELVMLLRVLLATKHWGFGGVYLIGCLANAMPPLTLAPGFVFSFCILFLEES